MSRLTRRTIFAAPLVITALGCKGEKRRDPPPPPPPPVEVADDDVADASSALPDAPSDAVVVQDGPDCTILAKDGAITNVQCPLSGPTLIAGVQDNRKVHRNASGVMFGYLNGPAHCFEDTHTDCPPGAICNPPAPVEAPCPDELLAQLGPNTPLTRRDGTTCWWNEIQVACPPPASELYGYVSRNVAGSGKDCLWHEMVDCPKGDTCNPPKPMLIKCPDPASEKDLPEIPHHEGRVEVSEDGTCGWVSLVRCPPNATCNPPEPTRVKCPTL